jgi:hypothetical protein
MNKLQVLRPKTVKVYEPQEALVTQAKDDAVIALAKRTKDWPLLVAAVDKKLDDQEEFVQWWRRAVLRKGGNERSFPADISVTAISAEKAYNETGISALQVCRWAKRLANREAYRAALYGPTYKKAMGEMDAASELVLQSISNEHYTPEKYIAAARRTLGEIDLDPATCEKAQKVVRAVTYFVPPTNGLEEDWYGRVWLNPPYGGLAQLFIAKLFTEMKAGRVSAAVLLVNAHCTDTGWFQPLFNGLLCFTDHRIDFYGDDSRSGSTHGSVFVYFGPDTEVFIREFSKFGAVVRRA